jgi:hypothetical protein
VDSQIDFAHLLTAGGEGTENKDAIRKFSIQLSTQVSFVSPDISLFCSTD